MGSDVVFGAPFKIDTDQTIEVTYDAVTYDLDLVEDTTYDSALDLIWSLIDDLETQLGDPGVFWAGPTSSGHMRIWTSDDSTFDWTWNDPASTEGAGYWLGYDADAVTENDYESDRKHMRGWYPGAPLLIDPEGVNRVANALVAKCNATSGHAYITTLIPHDTPLGFRSMMAQVRMVTDDIDDDLQGQSTMGRLWSWIVGERDVECLDIWYGLDNLSPEPIDMDALSPGGAVETGMIIYDAWIDPDDYDSFIDYLSAWSSAVYWMHPDQDSIPIMMQYEPMRDYWMISLQLYEEVR